MVQGQRPTPGSSGGSHLAVQAWLRPLQQALQLEADRGFEDLLGRKERFSAFLQRVLASPPEDLDLQRFSGLGKLSGDFSRYGR